MEVLVSHKFRAKNMAQNELFWPKQGCLGCGASILYNLFERDR